TAAQDFRLSAKPVLQLMAMGKSLGLRQFISTTCDQLFDLLHALEEWVTCKKSEDFWRAKKFCRGFHPGFSFQENLCSANCAALVLSGVSPVRPRVERSGADCPMNPQIRPRRRHTHGAPRGEHCRVSAPR